MAASIGGFGYLFARTLGPQQPVADVDHLKRDIAAQQQIIGRDKGQCAGTD